MRADNTIPNKTYSVTRNGKTATYAARQDGGFLVFDCATKQAHAAPTQIAAQRLADDLVGLKVAA